MIKLIDAFSGSCLQTFTGHINSKQIPLEASFSPDSQFVISGSTDGRVHIWNAENGTKVCVLNGDHTGPVQCVQFNPKYMMMASSCKNMAFWLPSVDEDTWDRLCIRAPPQLPGQMSKNRSRQKWNSKKVVKLTWFIIIACNSLTNFWIWREHVIWPETEVMWIFWKKLVKSFQVNLNLAGFCHLTLWTGLITGRLVGATEQFALSHPNFIILLSYVCHTVKC